MNLINHPRTFDRQLQMKAQLAAYARVQCAARAHSVRKLEKKQQRVESATYITKYNALYWAGDKLNPGLLGYQLQLPRNGNSLD